MSVPGVLLRSRAAAKRRMRARLVIEREGPATTGVDGTVTTPWLPVYGTESKPGIGWVSYPGLAFESRPEAAGTTLTLARVVVHIPHGPSCRPGDRITVISDPDNPGLVGSVFEMASDDTQSQTSHQRLLCLDVQAGR